MKKMINSKWLPAIFFAFTLFMLGFEIGSYNFTIDYMVKEFGLNGTEKGIIVALEFAAMVIAPILFGKLANKDTKKRTLYIFASVFLIGSLIVVLQTNIILLGIGMVLIGAGFSVVISVVIALIMDVYPKSNSRINSLSQAMFSIGAVISPLVGSSIINTAGTNWRSNFVIIIGITIIDMVLLSAINFTPKETRAASTSIAKGVFPYELVILICFIALLYVGTENGVSAFIGGYMKDSLSSTVLLSSLSISLFWAFMIPSRLLVSVLYKKKNIVLFTAMSGVIICSFLLSTTTSYQEGLVYIALAGFFCGPIYPLLSSYITQISNGNTIKASIFITVFGSIGGVLATFGMGAVSDLLGDIKYSFVMTSILMLTALAVFIVFRIKANKQIKENI